MTFDVAAQQSEHLGGVGVSIWRLASNNLRRPEHCPTVFRPTRRKYIYALTAVLTPDFDTRLPFTAGVLPEGDPIVPLLNTYSLRSGGALPQAGRRFQAQERL